MAWIIGGDSLLKALVAPTGWEGLPRIVKRIWATRNGKASTPSKRCASALGLIGIAHFFAGLIVITNGNRRQRIWAAGILFGYWAVLMRIPTSGVGRGVLTLKGFLGGYIDRHLLPGRLYDKAHDPEGILAALAATAMALLDAQAGR